MKKKTQGFVKEKFYYFNQEVMFFVSNNVKILFIQTSSLKTEVKIDCKKLRSKYRDFNQFFIKLLLLV